jgi:hypothetical protein
MAAPVPAVTPRAAWQDRIRSRQAVSGIGVVATVAGAVSLVVYAATALPGVSFGDWAEMQQVPARLEVPHTTGFPLYVLLGWLFSLLPIGSVAYRADLLSAVSAAGAVATTVLIAGRLGVRPAIALAAALSLAATATLWEEATFAEMNGLHLFLSALLVHRALVWRAERRDRDLRLGALIAGLSLANHLLALSVVGIVGLWVALGGGWRIVRRPALLAQCLLLFGLGLSPYLFIVARALLGPPEVYGYLLTWDGFRDFVTGARFRSDMRFWTVDSVVTAIRQVPAIFGGIERASNLLFSHVAWIGGVLLYLRDGWSGTLLAALVAGNIYMYVGYRNDLAHYLLLTWLVLAVWLAVLAETGIAWFQARLPAEVAPQPAAAVQLGLVAIAVLAISASWPAHDQSRNRDGEAFAEEVFGYLPQDAVLVSYWDVLTNLNYEHCIEGARPDLALVTYDKTFTATCDLLREPYETIILERPMYALFVHDFELDPLRGSFDLVPVATIKLPYGYRMPEHDRTLFRLELKALPG